MRKLIDPQAIKLEIMSLDATKQFDKFLAGKSNANFTKKLHERVMEEVNKSAEPQNVFIVLRSDNGIAIPHEVWDEKEPADERAGILNGLDVFYGYSVVEMVVKSKKKT